MFKSTEEVNGIIIGGEYFTGAIYYDGRKQKDILVADTEEGLIKMAEDIVKDFKDRLQGYPCFLYPDNSKWELRIY